MRECGNAGMRECEPRAEKLTNRRTDQPSTSGTRGASTRQHQRLVGDQAAPRLVPYVVRERVLEWRHDPSALAPQRHTAWPARRESELVVRPRVDQRLVEVRGARRDAREVGPAALAMTRELPDAALAVDQQVERRVHEVGDVRR